MSLSNTCNLLGRAPTASSLQIGNVDGPNPAASTDNALVRWDGTTGRLIQNGVVTEADFTGTLTGPTDQATTSAAGSAFTNQPSNDGVEVLSSDTGDTTQTVTIIGTTTGTDTVVVETVTLTGTTFVPTAKTNWGVVLAVKKSAATLGTVTVRKATGDATITAGLTAAVLSVGVNTVTNTAAYNRAVSMVGSGATTKQVGLGGTNSASTQIYDSKALTGATAVTSNSSFLTVTEIYTGDLEATRTVAITTNGGWALTGGGGATLSFDTGGSITVTAGGTNQNITLTPSGTGEVQMTGAGLRSLFLYRNVSYVGIFDLTGSNGRGFATTASQAQIFGNTGVIAAAFVGTHTLLGGLTTDGVGVLQFPTATTSAGGITFGTDWNFYRASSSIMSWVANSSTTAQLNIAGTANTAIFGSNSSGAFMNAAGATTLVLQTNTTTALTLDTSQNAAFAGSVRAGNFATVSAPPYAKGVIYFDTTLNKLRVGGATAFETITSA